MAAPGEVNQAARAGVVAATPSKQAIAPPQRFTSPTFEFSFDRQDSNLSSEAQKIMDSVREEAARIKANMLEEKKKQAERDGEAFEIFEGSPRKIAKPKAKAGRFSDIHKQQFNKMDSITQHASTWKAQLKGDQASLKRSPSKAGLDEKTPKSLTQSKSMKSLHFGSYERNEQEFPGKRVKRDFHDDTSAARPVSRDTNDPIQDTPMKIRLESKLPSAITTPTKASLARSASVKSLKTSGIPSLSHSASTKTLGAPTAPKSEGGHKYLGSLQRFGAMLHRHTKPSEEPTMKPVASPSRVPQSNMSFNKDLPSLPSSPSKMNLMTNSSSQNNVHRSIQASPSKSNIPTPKKFNATRDATVLPSAKEIDPVAYPVITSSPNVTRRKPVPVKPAQATGPGDFTFRSAHTIKFCNVEVPVTKAVAKDDSNGLDKPLPFQPSPSKTASGRTIRHVRPSGLSTPFGSAFPMPGSFEPLPAIEHGINNKKRKHVESEDESDYVQQDSDVENKPPTQPLKVNVMRAAEKVETDSSSEPKAKKQRMDTGGPSSLAPSTSPVKLDAVNTTSPLKRRFGGGGAAARRGSTAPRAGSASPKKGLSLSRLNMLARPKERR